MNSSAYFAPFKNALLAARKKGLTLVRGPCGSRSGCGEGKSKDRICLPCAVTNLPGNCVLYALAEQLDTTPFWTASLARGWDGLGRVVLTSDGKTGWDEEAWSLGKRLAREFFQEEEAT